MVDPDLILREGLGSGLRDAQAAVGDDRLDPAIVIRVLRQDLLDLGRFRDAVRAVL